MNKNHGVIEGEFIGRNIEGFGTFTWPDGRKYFGFWKDNKQHGDAVFTSAKGKVRRGRWESGERLHWYDSKTVFPWE